MKKSLVALTVLGSIFVGCSSDKDLKIENMDKKGEMTEEAKALLDKKNMKGEMGDKVSSLLGDASRHISSLTGDCSVQKRDFNGEAQFRINLGDRPYNQYWYSPEYFERVKHVAVKRGKCSGF